MLHITFITPRRIRTLQIQAARIIDSANGVCGCQGTAHNHIDQGIFWDLWRSLYVSWVKVDLDSLGVLYIHWGRTVEAGNVLPQPAPCSTVNMDPRLYRQYYTASTRHCNGAQFLCVSRHTLILCCIGKSMAVSSRH